MSKNIQAIDKTVELLHQVPVPAEWRTLEVQPRKHSENVSDFVHEIVEPINRQEGNALSVATLAKNGMTDGRMPLGTAAVENVELH